MAQEKFISMLSPTALWGKISSNSRHYLGLDNNKPTVVKESVPVLCAEQLNGVSQLIRSRFIKCAGLSGATAVCMGAYGSHVFFSKPDVPNELKEVYRTANYYHFLHTLALLAVPLVRFPVIVGTLFSAGTSIFCGTCYYYALSGDKSLVAFTPFGGILLIFGWLAMFL